MAEIRGVPPRPPYSAEPPPDVPRLAEQLRGALQSFSERLATLKLHPGALQDPSFLTAVSQSITTLDRLSSQAKGI